MIRQNQINHTQRVVRDNAAIMVVSYDRGLYKVCDAYKVSKGRFNTRHSYWMLDQVVDFILKCKPKGIIDPFAGDGDLLAAASKLGNCAVKGYDIEGGKWIQNDSLIDIPRHNGYIIITNPPYLAKHSAKRKGVFELVEKYYRKSGRSDLYQIALDICLRTYRHTVAIVPETIINSGYPLDKAVNLTIIEDSPFTDTENPVCVVCFDSNIVKTDSPMVYIRNKFVGTLNEINARRIHPRYNYKIRFNSAEGQIGLRAIDMSDPAKPIKFMPKQELDYDSGDIKMSSRLVTYIRIEKKFESFIAIITDKANQMLARLRHETSDIILSPFKGNTNAGKRRRRLDYHTARAILENAIAVSVSRDSGRFIQTGFY